MLKIKKNQLSLGSVIYDTGYEYSSHHELKKVVVNSLKLDDAGIYINDYYRLYHNANEDYYYNRTLYFSENKANKVIKEYTLREERRKLKYEKEKAIEKQYEQQIIDNKLKEKYIDKPIMLNRGKDGWIKSKIKEVFATEDGIYITPYFDGHICKLSREGKTWKMWSELEELEIQKEKIEKRISDLKLAVKEGKNND